MTVDSHQHFWRYSESRYGWIPDEMDMLRRDFLPSHLHREIERAGVDGVVSVQALQSLEETHALLGMAHRNRFILGVVGWVPLIAPDVSGILEDLAADPCLKACRHVLQDEPDDGYMLRADFNEGIRAVTAAGLVYDILIYERHLPQTVGFVDQHPDQVFVLDHIGKPRIRDGSLTAWQQRIHALARRPNVFCKLSGVATEAHWTQWTEEQLRPYFETVLDAFGPHRLMFGSDWPMCLTAVDYSRWFGVIRRFLAPLARAERDQILGGTAVEVYGLAAERTLE